MFRRFERGSGNAADVSNANLQHSCNVAATQCGYARFSAMWLSLLVSSISAGGQNSGLEVA
jgi:hypothetical protein